MQIGYTPLPQPFLVMKINRPQTGQSPSPHVVQSGHAVGQLDFLHPDDGDCSRYPRNVDQAVWDHIMVLFIYVFWLSVPPRGSNKAHSNTQFNTTPSTISFHLEIDQSRSIDASGHYTYFDSLAHRFRDPSRILVSYEGKFSS